MTNPDPIIHASTFGANAPPTLTDYQRGYRDGLQAARRACQIVEMEMYDEADQERADGSLMSARDYSMRADGAKRCAEDIGELLTKDTP